MKTGIVVNNYDPEFRNRCQIRVFGIHTQVIDGKYVILDEDLPWAIPAPNPSYNGGYYAVPKKGSRVYVDVVDAYNITYYGNVEINGDVKKMLHGNADASESMKVIAYSDDPNDDGTVDNMRIYYLPSKGLVIECNGNRITLPKDGSMEIQTKNGAGISVDNKNNDITIHTDSKVNLDCNEVKITSEAEEKLILGSRLMKVFNEHKHFTSDGQTSKPIQQIVPDDFSKKIKIG